MKKMIVIALLAFASVASAQELPAGRWWRNDNIVKRLELSADQQTRLEAIFQSAANDLIDRRAEVEKAVVALRSELDQDQPNRASLQRVAARLNEARGRLFEREVLMLADMRSALDDDQWRQLRQFGRQRAQQRRPAAPRRR